MQNIYYFNDEIQNTKNFRIMFSSIQNAKFIAFELFCQKSCMMFSSIICKVMDQNIKNFEIKVELNTP